jgi:hypothetical protein
MQTTPVQRTDTQMPTSPTPAAQPSRPDSSRPIMQSPSPFDEEMLQARDEQYIGPMCKCTQLQEVAFARERIGAMGGRFRVVRAHIYPFYLSISKTSTYLEDWTF